jgi:ABC-2 type transport system ATP-binding protein
MRNQGLPNAITVSGLRKTYGQLEAVRNIDLEVHHGEIFALLGPNGAGKTTTVEILEGYRKPTTGSVMVLGVDPSKADGAWRSRVGFVHQSSKIADDCTVEEVIGHYAMFYRTPRDLAEVISLVGLVEKRKDRVGKLSGGQQRRLDVALGIVGRPEVLFLDEPTTGFDPEARRQFWDLIEQLKSENTTILLTTHYLDEAERLADRLGVIIGGRMIEIGTPQTLGGRVGADVIVKWTVAGEPHEEKTKAPTAVVQRLANEFGGEIPGLTISRPTLEDVYLTMVRTHANSAVGAA